MLTKIQSNTISDEIKMISISELHDSPDNFFQLSNIEELAETILAQGGVKENLIVRTLETGGYEIISGHRRKSAVQYLLDNGHNIGSKLPCLIQNYSDENDKMMNLIMMNVSQRVISDAEMLECYNKLHKVFEEKKALGEKFGRLRNKIAETLNVSTGKIAQIENVQKNAIPEIVEAVENGEMSITTANEVAKLDKDEQKKIAENPEKAYTEAKKKNDKKKSVKLDTKKEEKSKPESVVNSETESTENDFEKEIFGDSPNIDIEEIAESMDTLKDKMLDLLQRFTVSITNAEDEAVENFIEMMKDELNKLNTKHSDSELFDMNETDLMY